MPTAPAARAYTPGFQDQRDGTVLAATQAVLELQQEFLGRGLGELAQHVGKRKPSVPIGIRQQPSDEDGRVTGLASGCERVHQVPDHRKLDERVGHAVGEEPRGGATLAIGGGCPALLRLIATNPLTPEELADYRRYPDTFFGAITPTAGSARTFVEKCDFLFNTYQHSTREKLSELMAMAPDIEHLRTLAQRDLAVVYCERMAHRMQVDEEAREAAKKAEAGTSSAGDDVQPAVA